MSLNDELFEIFSNLSASDLYKLSTVSKSFNELLSTDSFIKKQYKNMQRSPDNCFFIQPDINAQYHSSQRLEIHALIRSQPKEDAKNSIRMPRESLDFLTEEGPIIASSNGLLCLRNVHSDDKPLCLFNPTTKNYLQLPNPHQCFNPDTNYRVVFDCTNDGEEEEAYLLMVLDASDSNLHSSKIYSPDLRIWRDGGQVDLGPKRMDFEHSIKVEGTVYLMSANSTSLIWQNSPFYSPYIVAYDISNSSSEFLSLPKGARKGLSAISMDLRIFEWGGLKRSICLVKLRDEKIFTVWVLCNEGECATRRWTHIFNKPVKALTKKKKTTVSSGDERVSGFTVVNGGVLLFATKDKVYSYDLKQYGKNNKGSMAQFVCAHKCGNRVQMRSCSSTLRPCGSGSMTLPSLSLQSFPWQMKRIFGNV